MNNKNEEKEELSCSGCAQDCEHAGQEEIEEADENKMYLHLDEDTNLECDIISKFNVDDRNYIVLLPIDEEEALIYEFVELDEDQTTLITIESEEEFEKVSKVFYDKYLEEMESEDNN